MSEDAKETKSPMVWTLLAVNVAWVIIALLMSNLCDTVESVAVGAAGFVTGIFAFSTSIILILVWLFWVRRKKTRGIAVFCVIFDIIFLVACCFVWMHIPNILIHLGYPDISDLRIYMPAAQFALLSLLVEYMLMNFILFYDWADSSDDRFSAVLALANASLGLVMFVLGSIVSFCGGDIETMYTFAVELIYTPAAIISAFTSAVISYRSHDKRMYQQL